ncbi:hypothetical protein B0J13DRAFT_278845 [Dactylonectria estremocensis]|uniref:Uncharacterized protein n=1 Tax=Dactylonectria estremocensis TaxID=1079267 RepID=A0A9P9JBC5_9HYPO|nr:hypothetical protein B0J13DRAFT_278845 [Dactylonectria estremocensis]
MKRCFPSRSRQMWNRISPHAEPDRVSNKLPLFCTHQKRPNSGKICRKPEKRNRKNTKENETRQIDRVELPSSDQRGQNSSAPRQLVIGKKVVTVTVTSDGQGLQRLQLPVRLLFERRRSPKEGFRPPTRHVLGAGLSRSRLVQGVASAAEFPKRVTETGASHVDRAGRYTLRESRKSVSLPMRLSLLADSPHTLRLGHENNGDAGEAHFPGDISDSGLQPWLNALRCTRLSSPQLGHVRRSRRERESTAVVP